MSNDPVVNHTKIIVSGKTSGGDVSRPIGSPECSPSGTSVLNGPVVCGNVKKDCNNYEGVLNVSSDSVIQDFGPQLDVNLAAKIDGNVKIEGDDKTANALDVTGDTLLTGNEHITGKVTTDSTINAEGTVTGSDCVTASGITLSSRKPFDIPHPNKEGYRLRHVCIEGPESGVYYRGRLKGSNIIELPSYWKDLVHEDSITVQLQPIGKSQNLVIESFNSEYVVIEIGANQDFLTNEILIDCFYHVYAERKDINPLILEYEGDSWKDYPDPNYKHDAVNPRYDDPKFSGPPNTITS